MLTSLKPLRAVVENVAVSNTVLQVFGASNWTTATPNGNQLRVALMNNSPATDLYVNIHTDTVDGESMATMVSATNCIAKLGPMQSLPFTLARDQTLHVVRPVASGDYVTAVAQVEVA